MEFNTLEGANTFMEHLVTLTLTEQVIAIYNLEKEQKNLLGKTDGWNNYVHNKELQTFVHYLGPLSHFKTVEELESKCNRLLGGN
jgi:hypothetical protein